MSSRAIAPIVGVISLLVLVTALGGVVAAVVPGSVDNQSLEPASITMSANEAGEIRLVHEGGDSIDTLELQIQFYIDGVPTNKPIERDETSAYGVSGWPSGPLNPQSDPTWEVGELVTVSLPPGNGGEELSGGSSVTAEFYLNGELILEISSTASG